MSNELKKYREQIDRIDDELLTLFNQRAGLAQQIGHAKGNSAVLRPEREAQVLQRMAQKNLGPLSNQGVTQLFTEVMSQCRALEAPISVAYLGPKGTYSEEAAIKRFGSGSNFFALPSIDDVFRRIEASEVRYGVVPVENSTEGAVGRTLDLLLQTDLKICGEVILPIHQCLLRKVDSWDSPQKIYGHTQSLGQCVGWLERNLKDIPRVSLDSNAEAARRAANDQDIVAVAGEQNANIYNLHILARNIEDDPRNTTRFLVIGKQDVAPSGKDKTSLVMSAANRPGAVHDLLVPLAQNGVSMTKLESRPSRAGLWEYVFYLDIEGHQSDAKVAAALLQLKQIAAFVKVLGSYPVAV
jgi:chorismate mutase/prephenate dehydratase